MTSLVIIDGSYIEKILLFLEDYDWKGKIDDVLATDYVLTELGNDHFGHLFLSLHQFLIFAYKTTILLSLPKPP
jgi:hypothetical protein